MAASVPLILKAESAARLSPGQRARNPNVAVVYATSDGRVEVIDDGKPSSLMDQVIGRYRYRYEVDVSDHQHMVQIQSMPPRARGGIFQFQATVNIGFRVVNPGEVVRRRVTDGLRVVCDYLMHALNEVTCEFPIEEAKRAQDAANARFGRPVPIDGGLLMYLCRVRLEPDQAAHAYLAAKVQAERESQVKEAKHHVNTGDAHREVELDAIRQQGVLDAREAERRALGARPMNLQDMVALHLERHPTDTAGAMEMIAQVRNQELARSDLADQRERDMFRFMADKDLIQPSDLDGVRDRMLRRMAGPSGELGSGPAGGWDSPLPGGSGAQRGEVPGLIPVYLLVDGSDVLAVHELDRRLQECYDAVAADPEIAAVVRLGVIGFGDDAAVHVPLHEPQLGRLVPHLPSGTGRVRLGAALERLRDCVAADAPVLKTQTNSLRRPQALLLSVNRPGDEAAWRHIHAELLDRNHNRFAPDLVACGVGTRAAGTMLDLATRPELAFVATNPDVATAVDDFLRFARLRIVEYARAVLDGDQIAGFSAPTGFTPAADVGDPTFPEGPMHHA